MRLFLEGVHAEYEMPASREVFVRTFRCYPLDDLCDAERRFRAHACRCKVRVCDRYFAAVVRDAHEAGVARRSAERRPRCNEGRARRARVDAAQRAAEFDAHPERRLHEAFDVLAETWLPDTCGFVFDGQLAHSSLRRAIAVIHAREPVAARRVLRAVITEVRQATEL